MLRAFLGAVAIIQLCLSASLAEESTRRVALVIGNAAYQNAGTLGNTLNDARDVAAALRKVGFSVIEAEDLDKRGMDAALSRFARAAQDTEAALFFYAGHGIQFQGQNYLVPVDAKLEDDIDIQFQASRVDDALIALSRSKGVRLLILDACRNNPFSERLSRSARNRSGAVTRGLARIEQTQGLIVAYATQANDVAGDGDGNGRNSPFSAALAREIPSPGLEVGTTFRRVASSVHTVTGGRQLPELSVSLLGEFYFSKAVTDAHAWSAIRTSSDPADFKDFIEKHPRSPLIDAAQARLDSIEREKSAIVQRQRTLADQAARENEIARRIKDLDAANESARAGVNDRLLQAEREAALRRQLERLVLERQALSNELSAARAAGQERILAEQEKSLRSDQVADARIEQAEKVVKSKEEPVARAERVVNPSALESPSPRPLPLPAITNPPAADASQRPTRTASHSPATIPDMAPAPPAGKPPARKTPALRTCRSGQQLDLKGRCVAVKKERSRVTVMRRPDRENAAIPAKSNRSRGCFQFRGAQICE